MRILPPPITATATASVRTKVHRVLRSIIDLGIADGTLRPDVTPRDIVTFGAMLAQTATHRSRLGREETVRCRDDIGAVRRERLPAGIPDESL